MEETFEMDMSHGFAVAEVQELVAAIAEANEDEDDGINSAQKEDNKWKIVELGKEGNIEHPRFPTRNIEEGSSCHCQKCVQSIGKRKCG